MRSIVFNNNVKRIGKITGVYPTKVITGEPIHHAILLDKVNPNKMGPILRSFIDNLGPIHSSDKEVVLYMWRKYLLEEESPISTNWHVDDPYFPENYPSYHSAYPTNKQILYAVSDHRSGLSNTKFHFNKIRLNGMSVDTKWFEIDTRLKRVLNPRNIYFSRDGEIIEYDNKTLHCPSRATNCGWRLLIKLVFYDTEVYEKVLKIGWLNTTQT